MQLNSLFWVNVFATVNYAISANILGVFIMPGFSHYILASKLMKGLIKAGHDVTMISPYEMTDVPKGGNYTDIVLEQLAIDYQNSPRNYFKILTDGGLLKSHKSMENITFSRSIYALQHSKVKQLLKSNEKFDVVIMEQFMNDALKVFSYLLNCPLITLSSMGVNSWVNPTVGNPQPVSYFPHVLNGDFSKDLSFINRAKNSLYYLGDYFVFNYYLFPKYEQLIHQYFPNSPHVYDLYTNVSLALLNSHTSIHPALPLVPNMVEIGGYFIDPPKKLPENLQHFLDTATDGAIYFSMGSILKSKDMPKEKKEIILNVLGKLKEKVLLKLEEELPGKPKNMIIQEWLPQQDILAHPNIKLFITHGGLLSITETIYHGIPILAIPVNGDQIANADRAVSGGFGLKLAYNDPDFNEATFEKLLNELLYNPAYRINAKTRSKIYHDRPMSPMETAIYWIEYVIRHKGAPHLRVAGVRLPWYKYFLIDVFGVLLLTLFIVFLILMVAVKSVCRRVSKVKNKQKVN